MEKPTPPQRREVRTSQASPKRLVATSAAPSRPVAAAVRPKASEKPAAANQSQPAEDETVERKLSAKEWLFEEAGPYAISMIVHAAILIILVLTMGTMKVIEKLNEPPTFDEVAIVEPPKEEEIKVDEPFDLTTPPDYDPSEIDLNVTDPHAIEAQEAVTYDDSETFEAADGGGRKNAPADGPQLGGDGGNFRTPKSGPALKGTGGIGGGKGFGDFAGSGGDGNGFGGRGKGHRDAMVGRYGGTKASERAVGAALDWFARHQSRDGSWTIQNFHQNCRGTKCSGGGSSSSDSGATALGVLPFLGAGETHMQGTKYSRNVAAAIDWLVSHQDRATGDLSAKSPSIMYSHGLATIAICEAYAMTGDSRLRAPCELAIKFIENAQNKQDGGWRYRPGEAGDTSVVGWQLMALKSAQMCKIPVNPATLAGVEKWLASVSKGDYSGIFRYQPEREGNLYSMTAVGVLCKEYLGANKGDPAVQEGIEYMMKNPPKAGDRRDIYYWYYATQAIKHPLGENWDKWNRQMRKLLIDTQTKGKACDTGSWDPKPDSWGGAGGRIMITSLSCLTLEVYYRHLPLYDLDDEGPVGKGKEGKGKDGKKSNTEEKLELSHVIGQAP
jgi:hypothetical protein